MTILPIKHKIERKSIKAQTQKYTIKKEQNRTHEKTQKSVQPCSIMYNENTISECVRKYILRRLVNFLVELQYFK